MKVVHEELSTSLKMILKVLKYNYKRTNETLLHSELKKEIIEDYEPKRHFSKQEIFNCMVFSLVNKNSNKHVMYLHGGAYVLKGNKAHFMFLRKLSQSVEVNIHYIDYPLAPNSTFENTIDTVVEVIFRLQRQYGFQNVSMMGDSAGGGLCLSVSKKIQHQLEVKNNILFSPWLDLSLDNEEIDKMTHVDVSLAKQDLIECANKYAPENLKNPDASPLYNDLSDLNEIFVYAGTHDLLYPDMELLEQKNRKVTLHAYVGAPHVFALFPFIKEQKEIIKQITEIL